MDGIICEEKPKGTPYLLSICTPYSDGNSGLPSESFGASIVVLTLWPLPSVATELSSTPKPESAEVPSSTRDSLRVATTPPKSFTTICPSGRSTGNSTSACETVRTFLVSSFIWSSVTAYCASVRVGSWTLPSTITSVVIVGTKDLNLSGVRFGFSLDESNLSSNKERST